MIGGELKKQRRLNKKIGKVEPLLWKQLLYVTQGMVVVTSKGKHPQEAALKQQEVLKQQAPLTQEQQETNQEQDHKEHATKAPP